MRKFTYYDVVCMNASFYLFGSDLYWQGAILFLIGGLTSGFVDCVTKTPSL